MNRGAIRALALGQVVTALMLVLVAWFAVQSSAEVDELRAELVDTRERLVRAETDRDRLQERVDALTAALLAAGVNPETVPGVVPPSPAAPETPRTGPDIPAAAPQPSPAAPSPAGDVPPAPSPAATPDEPPPQPPAPTPPCTVGLLGTCLLP